MPRQLSARGAHKKPCVPRPPPSSRPNLRYFVRKKGKSVVPDIAELLTKK
jgi:hypothetical protein